MADRLRLGLAGCTFELVDNGLWWGAVGEDEWPKDPRSRAAILASMLPETGDRRQEVTTSCFTGVHTFEVPVVGPEIQCDVVG